MIQRRGGEPRRRRRRRRSSPTSGTTPRGSSTRPRRASRSTRARSQPEDLAEIRADLEALKGVLAGGDAARHQGGAHPPGGQRVPDRRRHLRAAGRRQLASVVVARESGRACQRAGVAGAAAARIVRPSRALYCARRGRTAAEGPREHVEKRDYYEVLGVERAADEQAIKTAYRQARAPVPPGQEPGRQARRGAVQGGVARPTRSSPIPTSAPATTASATRTAAVPGREGFPFGGAAARPSTTSSATSSARCSAAAAAARGSASAPAAPTSATTSRSRFEEAAFGTVAAHHHPAPEGVRGLPRLGREARHRPAHLPDLRRLRRGPAHAGLLLHRPHLPPLPGLGPRHRGQVPDLRRPGRAARGGDRRGEGPARRGHRHAPQALRRGRARARRRAAARATSTSCCRCASTRSSRARTPRSSARCPSPSRRRRSARPSTCPPSTVRRS